MYKYFLYSLYIYIFMGNMYLSINNQLVCYVDESSCTYIYNIIKYIHTYIQDNKKMMYKEFMNSNKYLHDAIKKTVNI